MLEWLERILGAFATIIGITAAILEIIRFFNEELANRIRDSLPKVVKHRYFTHGAFLLLGAMIGIFITSQRTISSPILPPYGTYEWQWAGENWYGRVVLEKQDGNDVISKARVGVIEKIVTLGRPDVTQMSGMLLESVQGTFASKSNNAIAIHLTVDKVNRRTNRPERETIDGTLLQIPCYAGKVLYAGAFEGDMILVRYVSTVGSVVEDWIRQKDPPPWFIYK